MIANHRPSPAQRGPTMPSIRRLLTGVVDYAGLFPPASLEMARAAHLHTGHRQADERWMLGRFVVPLDRLEELAQAMGRLREARGLPWSSSVLLAGEPESWAARLRDAVQKPPHPDLRVTAIETRPAAAAEIERTLRLLPPEIEPFVEVPAGTAGDEWIETMRGTRARAKLRTGGVTAEAFPSVGDLTRFVAGCARADLPFKATAGLHHPLTGDHPLTYERESAVGRMFGFLNLLLAAVLHHAGRLEAEEIPGLLRDGEAASFRFTEETAAWRGRLVNLEEIARARDHFALGFGSCSFEEPIGDLRRLGWL